MPDNISIKFNPPSSRFRVPEGRFVGSCLMPTDFMEPSIKKGSVITVDTRHYALHEPARWEVIVFWGLEMEEASFRIGLTPEVERLAGPLQGGSQTVQSLAKEATRLTEGQGSAVRPHLLFCKRIAGLPGERLQFTDSSLMVNGKAIEMPGELARTYRSFGKAKEFLNAGASPFEVPGDSVFVLSDNVLKGRDSRVFGAVPMITVLGRAIV